MQNDREKKEMKGLETKVSLLKALKSAGLNDFNLPLWKEHILVTLSSTESFDEK